MRAIVLVAVVVVCAVAPSTVCGEMKVEFREDHVLASGVTPGARAILFGVVNEPQGYYVRIGRRQATSIDLDLDGSLTFEMSDKKIPARSVWAVVDLASGEIALAAPTIALPVRRFEVPPNAFKSETGGLIRRIEFERSGIEVLVVRPGAGLAYAGAFRQGTDSDADGANDTKLTAGFDKLTQLLGPTLPLTLQDRDVLVAIDERSLEVSVTTVGKRP